MAQDSLGITWEAKLEREAGKGHEGLCILSYWCIKGCRIGGLMGSYLCVRKITLAALLRDKLQEPRGKERLEVRRPWKRLS